MLKEMKKVLGYSCLLFLVLAGSFSLPVTESQAYTFGVVSCRTANPSTNPGGWANNNAWNMGLSQTSSATGCPNNSFTPAYNNGVHTHTGRGSSPITNSANGRYAGHFFNLGDPVATGREIAYANLHFGNRSEERRALTKEGTVWNKYDMVTYGAGYGTAQNALFTQTVSGAVQYGGQAGPHCGNTNETWHTQAYCYIATFGPTFFNPSNMGAAGQQYGLGFFLQCKPSYAGSNNCYEGDPGNIEYSSRVSFYNAEVRIQDNQPPVLFNGGGGLWTGNYLRGNQALYFAANDNSGVRRLAASVTSIGGGATYAYFQPQPDNANCAVSNAAADQYLNISPCPNKDLYSEWNTASVADGVYQVNLSAVDPSSYPAGISRAVTIDNSAPGPNNAPQANPSNNCNSVYVYPPPGTANGWIKGSIAVGGQACDSASGIASSTIQSSVNGGSWTNLPSCNQTANPGDIAQLSCNFNSTPYSEGSTVTFRVVATNRVDLTTTSNNSSNRRIDNTAPSVTGLAFFHNDGAFTPLAQAPDKKRWTNRPETLGRWDQASAGAGSPITQVYTQYTSGPSSTCSTPQATVTHSPSTTTRVLPNNSTETCQQGKHDLRVWARDEAGNVSSSVPPAAFGSYYYDTVEESVTGLAFFHNDGAFTPLVQAPDNKRWTNRSETLGRWNQVSAGAGSPITDVYTQYTSGPDSTCNTPQTTVTHSPSTTTRVLPNNSTETCQQGKHDLRVWARDLAGNVSSSSPPAAFESYYYDTIAPSVSGLTFSHNDDAFTPLAQAPDNKRWTNRSETRGRWDPVSAGAGSPITDVYTQYTSGPDSPCSTPQTTVTHSPSTTTRVLPNNSTETCQQGKHDLRVWGRDLAGNDSSSSPPAAFESYYYDTVAPSVSGLAFFHNDGAFTPLNQAPDSKRWTNRPETLGRWDQVSAGVGSPITEVYTQYTSGPDSPCSAPQARVTHSTSTTTRVVPNNPTDPCQQGKHDLRVWGLDLAGNTSSSSPPAAFESYYYDTIAPAAPTGGGADPSGWTNVNDFKVFWKNSGYNNTTQSPFRWHPYRINNSSPKQKWENCFGSNEDCERTGVTVPEATGVYPYKTWHRDWADNENEENSITISLYYRRGGEACIVE
jgi:hypothetical protein